MSQIRGAKMDFDEWKAPGLQVRSKKVNLKGGCKGAPAGAPLDKEFLKRPEFQFMGMSLTLALLGNRAVRFTVLPSRALPRKTRKSLSSKT
jgi:hypothetical protein